MTIRGEAAVAGKFRRRDGGTHVIKFIPVANGRLKGMRITMVSRFFDRSTKAILPPEKRRLFL